jgi:hypothetical protein
MIIMSLRGAFAATKQSPVARGDCSAAARNDTWELQSASGEELSPALMPSILDKALKGEL